MYGYSRIYDCLDKIPHLYYYWSKALSELIHVAAIAMYSAYYDLRITPINNNKTY